MAAKISIFPRDRLAWHRQMAEDVELSHVAFRLGVCIGGHFNNRTRKTFVGYEKLGQQMQVCRTTVVNAVRELAARGHLEVKAGGGRKIANEYRMSSPARRALTTAEIIARKLDYKRKNIVVEDRLYPSAVDDLLNVVQKLSDKLERVMLFGHNPELTEFARRLSREISHMPTCAVAEFKFRAKSWSNIGNAKLAKVALDYPKKSKAKASRR
jgi:phosphohistidine phosphatase